MSFELLCMTFIALLVGLAIAFLGYKMLWIILPILGVRLWFWLRRTIPPVSFRGWFSLNHNKLGSWIGNWGNICCIVLCVLFCRCSNHFRIIWLWAHDFSAEFFRN